MATITKDYTETTMSPLYPGATVATHTLTFTANDVYITSPTFSLPNFTICTRYNNSSGGRNGVSDGARVSTYLLGSSLKSNYYDSGIISLSANVNSPSLSFSSASTGSRTTSNYFTSSNSTERSIPITLKITSIDLKSGVRDISQGALNIVGYTQITTVSDEVGTLFNLILDVPPTFDVSTLSIDTSEPCVGVTTATVTVSNSTAYYGGTITSATLTIGNQTVSRQDNGELSILLNTTGTFTPTVTVTDSRGQITTETLDPITITQHTAPTLTPVVRSTAPYYNIRSLYQVAANNIQTYDNASVSSIILYLGSQNNTKTSSFTDLYEISPNTVGTFIPKLVITDTYNVSTEYSLAQITVQQYPAPSVSFTVVRTDENGIVEDEGESALITATFSWLSEIADLTAPIVEVTDLDGIVQTSSIIWYTSLVNNSLSNEITDWSQISQTDMPIYGLITNNNTPSDLFDLNYSYYINITPVDDIPSSSVKITQILGGAFYTVDFLAGGHGIAFGKPSLQAGFECAMPTTFDNILIAQDMTQQEIEDFIDGLIVSNNGV